MSSLNQYYQILEGEIFPNKKDIFRAFNVCPESKLKVVFLGQDPYLNGKATGLCFANSDSTLQKDWSEPLKAIQDSLERVFPGNGMFMNPSLEFWANQGILCLNSALTTSAGKRSKHILFWEPFISRILAKISERKGIVFVLFGAVAKTMRKHIESEGNLIIELDHPLLCSQEKRPLNLDFIHINEYLYEHHGEGISWNELPF